MTETDADTWRQLLEARAAVDGRRAAPALPATQLAALFGELARTPRGARFVIAHLGQSLDGRIATESGHSHYIGSFESIVHLHRLRALVDAVVVGIGTVLADQPRLTTRHVEGPNPTRVVLDPRGRLRAPASLLDDGAAPTLVVHAEAVDPELPAHVARLAVPPTPTGILPPAAVLAALAARGLARILVEGGGRTVSSFVAAGAVDRLQFAVAPMLIGSGRPALTLPAVETLAAALRPRVRRFDLGRDTLFDFDLHQPAEEETR